MKKGTWKAVAGIIVIVAVIFLVYRASQPENFAKDMEQLRTLTESGSEAYSVEVTDAAGNTQTLADGGKEQLAALILEMVSEAEAETQIAEDVPALQVKIVGEDTSFEAQLTVYDQGEATDAGVLQTTNDTYAVQNCGQVLNYLAELGFYTER